MAIRAHSISGQRGFTLLEMLVVMILTGMITGILMQGLHQVFRLQTHFGREIFDTQQGEMYTDWFRQSVNGLMPDYADGKHQFKGTQREFSGLTLAPLDAANTALLPFSWRLKFDPETGRTQLRYGSGDDAPAVLSWSGNSGRFVYFDANNEAHDDWPPFLGKWPQLPQAIYLENQNATEPRIIVAVPKGLENPLPRQKDLQD
ncbi:MAG TPA: type II secretion system protein [Rhodocyclaceae bacterium]|nr:type II secretion system protein [Rhodocyclaceae bacterium]